MKNAVTMCSLRMDGAIIARRGAFRPFSAGALAALLCAWPAAAEEVSGSVRALDADGQWLILRPADRGLEDIPILLVERTTYIGLRSPEALRSGDEILVKGELDPITRTLDAESVQEPPDYLDPRRAESAGNEAARRDG
jgi:hypothetical protein